MAVNYSSIGFITLALGVNVIKLFSVQKLHYQTIELCFDSGYAAWGITYAEKVL
jgi:hypothetical protein